MADQLALILEPSARAEARRRGLEVDDAIADRDRRVVGIVGAAIANLNYVLEEAATAGFEVIVTAHHQDVARGPKRALIRGRIRRLAVDARV